MPPKARKQKQQITYPKFEGSRPDFTNPPVSEVVLAIRFEQLPLLGAPQIGLLWDRYRDKYPNASTKPPLNIPMESFGLPDGESGVRIQLTDESGPVRYWFENKNGTELIQIQNDHFIFNWKKGAINQSYPRYEKVRARFRRHLKTFETFLAEHDLGKIIPTLCEVTYVNELYPGKGWTKPGQAHRVFSTWSRRFSDGFSSQFEFEDINFRFRQRILSEEKTPVGRFYVSLDPRYHLRQGDPMLIFALTARGVPLKNTKKAVIDFFNLGREITVRSFASMTTKRMHEIWGRTDA